MPIEYVLDASAAGKLIRQETETKALRAWMQAAKSSGSRIVVPPVFPFELRNVAAKAVRAGDVRDAPTAAAACEAFRALVEEEATASHPTIALAVDRALSTHDASYILLLSGQRKLVTYDAKMADAVRALHGPHGVLSPA